MSFLGDIVLTPPLIVRTALVVLFLMNSAFAQGTVPEQAAVEIDAEKHIWPVLRQQCLRCHCQELAEGGLRLDQKSWIEKGGHTGNVVLGTVEDSELLRRLLSDDPLYRMPKDASPLSDQTIASFRAWIESGAPWPNDQPLIDLIETAEGKNLDWQTNLSKRAARIFEPLAVLGWPAIVALILMVVQQRMKASLEKQSSLERTNTDLFLLWIRPAHYAVVAMAFLLAAVWLWHRNELATVAKEKQELTDKLEAFGIVAARRQNAAQKMYPYPDLPKHPPRLGGTYYRGNDERNPKLFNNGNYRTATMQLSLRGANGQLLQRGDLVSGELNVCLEIQRAPFATSALFRDKAIEKCALKRHLGQDTEAPSDAVSTFKTVEPGERWKATYPIGSRTVTSKQVLEGLIYVTSGDHAHYGIKYELELVDGVIADQSQLWMGATFLSGKIIRPPSDILLPHEWFGSLPLPEIVGGNTNDPKLLGIPEHQGTPSPTEH